MKVKQVVETSFNNLYVSWSSLQFTDSSDNKVSIEITDDQLLIVADKLAEKAASIRKEREEEAAKKAEEAKQENADEYTEVD